MAVDEFHEKNNSEASYRVYRSGFGTAEAFFMVAVSAKDPAHMDERGRMIMEKLGPEYQELLNNAMKYTLRYEKLTGWIRPDLSVTDAVATKK